ncbi:hypothetical protein ACP70R_037794 [Stipagrostis hirtigluma subsp. patula]
MPGGAQRRRRRKARQAPPPPIHSLGEDLLLEIFLRLPSLPALVRAACVCRAWRRAVASSPTFRRRFRALHPPPLLGIFFDAATPVRRPAFPSFVPTLPSDRDQAAAVRGGDFFLTSLHDHPGETTCWLMMDCHRGYVLLADCVSESFAVMNPLTRRIERLPVSSTLFPSFWDDKIHHLAPRLLCSDQDPASFRVLLLDHEESGVRATVFSSDTGEWSILPSLEVDIPLLEEEVNVQMNGILYWVCEDWRRLVSLDTSAMDFSITELPHCLRWSRFGISQTYDGTARIVYADGLNVGVLVHTRDDDDGVEKWVLDRVVPMETELKRVLQDELYDDDDGVSELHVFAVHDDCVYLTTSALAEEPQKPCCFLSLCLETMKLEKLCWRTYDSCVYPYIMAWPSCLVGNRGRFAVGDAP